MKSLLLASAMILAAPAVAQTATPNSTNAAQPATSTAPAAPASSSQVPQPATDGPTAQSATPATPEAPATPAQPANPADAVAQVVSNDWAKYDADKNDGLSKEEFGTWMAALREANPAQKAAVTDPEAWTTAAFAQADKDKNGTVSKAELQGFLKG
jgi:hypothetical protein